MCRQTILTIFFLFTYLSWPHRFAEHRTRSSWGVQWYQHHHYFVTVELVGMCQSTTGIETKLQCVERWLTHKNCFNKHQIQRVLLISSSSRSCNGTCWKLFFQHLQQNTKGEKCLSKNVVASFQWSWATCTTAAKSHWSCSGGCSDTKRPI